MEKVLVVGASGSTGYKIVNILKSSQHFEPIAMVRSESQRLKFEEEDVKTIYGDLEKEVSHAIIDIDRVIFAAGSGGKNVQAVDRDGAKKMISASGKANVKKFVMLSSMGADKPEQSDELQDYLKAKHQADEFLKDSELNFTIVRPGTLNDNKGKGKIELAKSLGKRGEISRDDVAETLVNALYDKTAPKATFEIIQGETAIGDAFENLEHSQTSHIKTSHIFNS
ncbi:SDR family oxidoreductase [Formosa sp. PL04]|uniref:SDR family oxidoreductase n=1 Tax=Formosa sp. PL04 TaxID=3081755 RepID=UPI002981AB4E|nr:SDR family oxidoreductase [Formosa sp. PL04]MDW5288532.1 SDR family oxidoreductase [Formosa sp. PL04]